MEGNPIHSFTTTKITLSREKSFKCMINGTNLTSLYTQLDILFLPPVAPIFPFNLEFIMTNYLSTHRCYTAGVILLEPYQLIDATQLELQTIQR